MAQEIWVCENQTITKWNRDILAYKEHLKSKIEKQTHDIWSNGTFLNHSFILHHGFDPRAPERTSRVRITGNVPSRTETISYASYWTRLVHVVLYFHFGLAALHHARPFPPPPITSGCTLIGWFTSSITVHFWNAFHCAVFIGKFLFSPKVLFYPIIYAAAFRSFYDI